MDFIEFKDLPEKEKKHYLAKLLLDNDSELDNRFPIIKNSLKDLYKPFPLTDIQESFLVGRKLVDSDKIGCHFYCEFEKGNLNVNRLKDAWIKLVHHHMMLHTSIKSSGTQVVLDEVPEFDMPVHDFRMAEHKDVEVHKTKVRDELSHKVYKASQWPLFDLQFTLLPEENVLIHLSIDEWIVDAASVDLLLDQWYQLYHDPSYTLPSLDVSFRDVVMAWKEFEESSVFQRDLTYWMGKLENAPGGPSLSINRAPKPREGYSYFPRYRLAGELEEDLWDRLKEKAKELEISPTVLLVTLFSQTLEEYSESDSFSLIQTYFNRLPLHPKLDQVVGPFISTNIFIPNQETNDWKKQAQANQKQMWEDLDHSSVSGVRAMRELRVKSKNKAVPNFPVVFTSMLNNVGKAGQGRTNWFHYMTYNITQTPQVYLDHQVSERNGVLHFNWDVAEGYLSRQLVEDMFKRYQDRLRDIVKEDEEDTSSMIFSSFELTDLQQTYVIGRLQDGNEQSCQIYQEFQVEQLNVSRLQKAWQQLIEHHEMLQAVVHENGTQEILDRVPVYDIPVHVVQSVPEMEVRVQQVREELQEQVFPLGKWPLFDLRVTQGSEASYVHLCTDALIADGASLSLLYQQLMNLYNNPKTELLPLEMSYCDYCNHIREERQSIKGQKAREYWERKMDTIVSGPQLSSQIDASRTVMQGVVSDWQALKEKATRRDVKPGTVLLTAFQEVLAAYFGEAFTTVVVNWDRPPIHEQVKDIIGDFTTLSYVESRSTEQSFTHKVLLNEKEIKEDLSHRSVSGMHGLRKRAMSQKSGGFLSFPIVFTNLVDDDKISLAPGWEMGKSFSKTPGVYLDMIPVEKNNALHFHWDLMEGLLPLNVVQALFSRYSERLAELASDEEKWEEQALERQTSTSGTIHEWFERQVTTYSQNIALKWNQEVVTYQTLNERSNQLARYLQSQGVGPEVMVGVCVERSLDMMVGILGILKAGGAYVPLDPAQPKDRLAYILADSDVSLVLTKETVLSSLPETKATLICLDKDRDLWSTRPITNLHVPMNIDNLAYVIYTSGSTGRPKGVLVTHQNVVRLMRETEEWYHFNESDTWTLYHSYAFDFSVWEIWGALLYGGKLIIVPYKTSRSFESFYRLLIEEGVTVLNQTPTAFRQLMRIDEQQDSKSLSLRYIIFGGEALDPRILEGWFERHGDQSPQLVNMYGITETTVHVTYRRMTKGDVTSPTSVIGSPIQDLQVYILDEDLQPVPRGSVGEMYIGGAGVARGYLNQDQLTKERFISSPFKSTERLYKTGDLAHYTETEELAFAGRNDNQVKVRGFRIELGEIEAVLKTHHSIQEAVVTVINDKPQENSIVAYVVLREPFTSKEIRKFMRRKVPQYMVPNIITEVQEIPLTLNGKLDYKGLSKKMIASEGKENDEKMNIKSILDKVADCFKEILNVPEIDINADIFDLGATSLTIVNVAEILKEKHNISLPIEVLLENSTVKEIATYYSKKKSPESTRKVKEKNDNRSLINHDVQTNSTPSIINLNDANIHPSYLTAYSAKQEFTNKSVKIDELNELLSLLQVQKIGGNNKYLYPSAGGKYPIQTYVHIKENGVTGLDAGVYYYHPQLHKLYMMSEGDNIKGDAFSSYHRDIYKSSKFAIFFIAEMAAIQPFYKKFSDSLVILDTGYMSQLLMSNQFHSNIGISPAFGVNFDSISRHFNLSHTHKFVHCLLGGQVDYEEYTNKELLKINETTLLKHTNTSLINPNDIKKLYGQMDYHRLSEEEIQVMSKEKLHIRKDISTSEHVKLRKIEYNDADYLARSSQREYENKKISLDKIGKLLSLVKNYGNQGQRLYSTLDQDPLLQIYIYVKANKVEGLNEGVYKYNKDTHCLTVINSSHSIPVNKSYTPFNRPHLSDAAFCMYLTMDLHNNVFPKVSLHASLLEAGQVGQLLMDRQADFNIGLVPVGGVNFDALSDYFEIPKSNFLVHSFIGGYFTSAHKKTNSLSSFKMNNISSEKIQNEEITNTKDHDVAVIGMSGRYPQASDLETLWQNLISSKDCIEEVPKERWNSNEFYNSGEKNKNSKSKWGGFLEDIDKFDSLFFAVPPSEAKYMDPQVRLSLEMVWHTLEDSGYTVSRLRELQEKGEKVGVFIGSMYQHYHLLADSNDLKAMLSIQSYSAIANRISHFYNFQGPSVAVDTACSSSLMALHLAKESIQRGECTTAIVLGVNLSLHAGKYVSLSDLGLLGSSPQSRSFHNGDGFVPGEGIGAVLLKSLPTAESRRDRIYGVIKASETNHSGNAGAYSSPSVTAQHNLIRETLLNNNLLPESISYIESAANGSPIGDAAEMEALTKVFLETKNEKQYPIGTIKSNIGHLEAASGISQLTKVMLQLKHKKIVPTLQFEKLNPFIELENSPFYFQSAVEEWKRPIIEEDSTKEYPLRAGICSFAAGGTNVFMVVEEYQQSALTQIKSGDISDRLVVLSAKSEQQLIQIAKQLQVHLVSNPNIQLESLAHTLLYGREHMENRIAFIADSITTLTQQLEFFLSESWESKNIFKGSFASQKSDLELFEDDSDYQSLLDIWMKKGNLEKIATLWVKGISLNWEIYRYVKEGTVISLPGYSFLRESHWITEDYSSKELMDVDFDKSKEVISVIEKNNTLNSIHKGEEFPKKNLQEIVTNEVCKLLEISKEKLDFNRPLMQYGFNSLYAMKLVNVLKESNINVTVKELFEKSTLDNIVNSLPQQKFEDDLVIAYKESAAVSERESLEDRIIYTLTSEVAKGTFTAEEAAEIDRKIFNSDWREDNEISKSRRNI
ncbi:non-ribosomal peptide synthetase [Shouchella miscanthi]|uniref:non-ribosomal peptide synthetase n=1 Tax=Shouchella miscanthi TaxID=2598861 RepID=UPI0011A4D5AF|nr:non-ribosomal peptide synthetase [Shouchella miscanthi]